MRTLFGAELETRIRRARLAVLGMYISINSPCLFKYSLDMYHCQMVPLYMNHCPVLAFLDQGPLPLMDPSGGQIDSAKILDQTYSITPMSSFQALNGKGRE